MKRFIIVVGIVVTGCWMDDGPYLERRDHFTDGDGDGFTPNDGDCDDDDAMVHPEADEICDATDNNCDGLVDEEPVLGEEWYIDLDDDGCIDDFILTCSSPSVPAMETPEDCT